MAREHATLVQTEGRVVSLAFNSDGDGTAAALLLEQGSIAISSTRLNPVCVSEIFASIKSVPLKSSRSGLS
jgi:hypothetical protein